MQLFDMDMDLNNLPVYKLKDQDYKEGAVKMNHVKNFTFIRESDSHEKPSEEKN